MIQRYFYDTALDPRGFQMEGAEKCGSEHGRLNKQEIASASIGKDRMGCVQEQTDVRFLGVWGQNNCNALTIILRESVQQQVPQRAVRRGDHLPLTRAGKWT